jgi:heat shock protein HslJ
MARTLSLAVVAAFLFTLPASAHAASPLEGTQWTFKRIDGRTVPPGFRGELRFSEHRRWGGRDDCNHIGGRYRGRGSRLRFTEIVSTAMGCESPGAPPPSVTGVLEGTRSYRLTPRRLLLLGRRGRTLARLAPAR